MRTIKHIKNKIENNEMLTPKEELIKDFLENNSSESLVTAFEGEDLSFIFSQLPDLKIESEASFSIKNDELVFDDQRLNLLTKDFKKENQIEEGLLSFLKQDEDVDLIPVDLIISFNSILFKRRLTQKSAETIKKVIDASTNKLSGGLGYSTGAKMFAVMCLGFSVAACGKVTFSSEGPNAIPRTGIVEQLPDAENTKTFELGDILDREISSISGESISIDLNLEDVVDTLAGILKIEIYGPNSKYFKLTVKDGISERTFEKNENKKFEIDYSGYVGADVELVLEWSDSEIGVDSTIKAAQISDMIKQLRVKVSKVN